MRMRSLVNATIVLAMVVIGCATPQGNRQSTNENEIVVPKEAGSIERPIAKKNDVFQAFFPFMIYTDQGSRSNHGVPAGWMGDYGDLKVNPGWTKKPHAGATCFQISYSAAMRQEEGWAGILWLTRSTGWGVRECEEGFNLTGAKRLTFWVRGEKGGEAITEFKVGGGQPTLKDSASASIGPVKLSKRWTKYTIDLDGKDLTNICGVFCWTASRENNLNGFTFYLDDIIYE